MPVNIDPRDEKIWKYLLEHKTPVTQEKITKYFLISKSHAGRALNYFVEQGIAEIIKIGTKKYYKVKE
jgi:predicted transcriptional regulator